MEILSSSANILKLCDHIINKIENKEHTKDNLTSYLNGLKYLCYGKIDERNCLLTLSPDEKLASVIQVVDFFKINPNDCINTADILLNYPYLSPELCKSLKTLFSSAFKMNKNSEIILKKLFNHKDFSSVSIELIEEILLFDSTNLELHLIKFYSNQNENQLSWISDNNKPWILWSCKSSKIFCKLCSIVNQILLTVKNKYKMIKIIRNFIENIVLFCEKNNIDFIGLYPLKLQPLISLMLIDLNMLPTLYVTNLNNCITEKINLLRKESPFEALMVLTHFDKWEKFMV